MGCIRARSNRYSGLLLFLLALSRPLFCHIVGRIAAQYPTLCCPSEFPDDTSSVIRKLVGLGKQKIMHEKRVQQRKLSILISKLFCCSATT
jgi:hypothetical protein